MEIRFRSRSVLAAGMAGVALLSAGLALAWTVRSGTPAAPPPSLDGIALAAPDAAFVTTPSAPDAWGGIRSGEQATLSDRVVQYRIEATLDPVKHLVTGQQQLTWRNRSAVPVRSVYVHLYMNAFEGAGSTFFTEQRHSGEAFRSGVDTKDGEWGHIALRAVRQAGASVPWHFVQPDKGPNTDHTVVRLDLPQAVAPGASTTLDIGFATQLPRVIARTGYFGSFHLVAQWFPKIAVLELPGERGATAPRWNAHEFHQNSEFYADFGSFDVTLTVPKDYTVGATGELQGAPSEKNGMVTRRYVQADVHDFAWTADRRSAKPLVETWTGPGSPTVTVQVIYPPEYAASAKPAMKAAKDALAYFSRTLGPYPYKTLTVVIPPHNAMEAGGMEYPTFITALGFESVAPKSVDEFALDMVTIHEFGHGYFYGILGSNEFEEPFLDEGMNEYWDSRMMRERGQQLHASTAFMKRLGIEPVFDVFDFVRLRSPRDNPADAPGENAWHRLQGIGPVYTRSAAVMHDLEARIGREAMERGFKEYYRRWKFRHPSIADLREALADGSGQRAAVERAFAQQVFSTARVDDRVAEISSEEELPQPGTRLAGGKQVEDTQEAVDKRIKQIREQWDKAHPKPAAGTGPFPFRTAVTVRRGGAQVAQTLVVKFADGSSETVLWDADERWRTFTWVRPTKAVSAQLDPRRAHLLDTNKLDDSRTLEADRSASTRWTGEFAAFVQLVLSLIATV